MSTDPGLFLIIKYGSMQVAHETWIHQQQQELEVATDLEEFFGSMSPGERLKLVYPENTIFLDFGVDDASRTLRRKW